MVLTINFEPGDTIWFIDSFSLEAASAVVLQTEVFIDNSLTPVIKHLVDLNNIQRYVEEDNAFATQTALADSFLPA